ncbi:MAG TPA: hypothetical protein VK151_08535 [Fluviicola sp.]|nr:hypothetical protein [Fluviicola sp.]
MSIQATLSVPHSLSNAIEISIHRTGEFKIVTENHPSGILPEAIAFISLDHSTFSRTIDISHVGIIRKRQRVTASQVRLLVTDILELPEPLPIKVLVNSMQARFRNLVESPFRSSGYGTFGEKTGELLFQKMKQLYPDDTEYFDGLLGKLGKPLVSADKVRAEDAAFEKDALGICLDVFMDSTERQRILKSWEQESGKNIGNSFLTGLRQYRAYEDDIINHDLRTVPGMTMMMANASGIVEFENSRREKLLVINANRKPLEKAYGIDLIYFHRQHQAFTFVQYKMMDSHGDGSAYYNPSESSHDKELHRMQSLQKFLDQAKKSATLMDYRLSGCPIFFKVCKKLQLHQNDGSIAMGAYIPLDQWNLLLNDDSTLGPKGGRQIGFHTLKRKYIGTSIFVEMIQRGLIGTHTLASEKVAGYIEEAIEKGHSVLYAIDESMRNLD